MKTQDAPHKASLPTSGQIERSLAQGIQALYRSQLGHQPGKVSCSLLEKKLIVVMEDSITQPEQILAKDDNENLAQKVRDAIDAAIEPNLRALITEKTGVEVLDLLSDTTVETGRIGIIAVLAHEPHMRMSNVEAATKCLK